MPNWLRRTFTGLAIIVATGAAGLDGRAHAQSPNDGLPIPKTTKDSLTAIERSFVLPAAAPLALFPQMREQMMDAPAFLKDSKVEFNPRSFYRDNVETTPKKTTVNEAWAGGGAGSVSVETGRLFDRVSGGFTLYNSFPIYAPYQYGNSQLLLPDQQGYTVIGQLYGRLYLTDDIHFTAGRSSWTTPYLNPHDNRMTPNTFYGYVLQGSIGNPDGGKPSVRFGSGYVAAIKPRDSDDFQSMAQAAGVNRPAGVGTAGALMTWGPLSVGAIDYFCQDTINIAYAEGVYGAVLPLGFRAVLALQYADQRSTGANLLNGGTYWSTGQFGTRLQFGYQTVILTAGFSAVAPGFAMQSPWSSNPIYTDAQVQSFQRAGEQALVLGVSAELTPLGLPGVATSIHYYTGATNAAAAGAPLVESEWDFRLDWRPEWKPLQGLWLSARYGHSESERSQARLTVDEIRLVLNYNVKLY